MSSLTIMIIKLIFTNPILGWLCLGPYIYFYLTVYKPVCEVSSFLILQVIGALYATKPGGTNLNFGANFLKSVMFFTNLGHCQWWIHFPLFFISLLIPYPDTKNILEITKRGIKIQTFCFNTPRDKRNNVAFDILTEGLVSQEMSPTTWNNGWSPVLEAAQNCVSLSSKNE